MKNRILDADKRRKTRFGFYIIFKKLKSRESVKVCVICGLSVFSLVGCGSKELQFFHLRYSPAAGSVSLYRVELTSLVTPKVPSNSVPQIPCSQIKASAVLINRIIAKDAGGNTREEYEFKDFTIEPSPAETELMSFVKPTKVQRTISPRGRIISRSGEEENFDLLNQISLLLTPELPAGETFIGDTWTAVNTTFIFDHLSRCQGEKCAVITKEIPIGPLNKKTKSRNFVLQHQMTGQGRGEIYYAWTQGRVIRARLELTTRSEITFLRKGVKSREELNQQILITIKLQKDKWHWPFLFLKRRREPQI